MQYGYLPADVKNGIARVTEPTMNVQQKLTVPCDEDLMRLQKGLDGPPDLGSPGL